MHKLSTILLALALIGAWASGSSAKLRVVCTTTLVGDVVAQIGGSEIEITVLMSVDVDPHAFEPTPRDLVTIAGADVVFLSGAGLEAAFEPFLDSAQGRIVSLSEHLALRTLEAAALQILEATGGLGKPDLDQAGGADPHVWLDPVNVISWTDVIEETLSDLDPANAAAFAERAATYRAELEALDSWIVSQTGGIPEANRILVTDHASFGYFADRYGFEQLGTVIPGFSTAAEPSARELAELVDAVLSSEVRAIFVGTTVNPSLAEQIATDTGVQVVFLYVGATSEPDGPAGSYLELMRYDVTAIVDGLRLKP